MMSCPELVALEALAGGAEDEATRTHVATCADCAAVVDRARAESAVVLDLRRALRRSSEPDLGDASNLPGFKVLRLLGRGGQGTVHEAIQRSTGRRVALKLLGQGRLATASQRERFLREIRLAASLRHPGIVMVYEAGETPAGVPFLAMELVEGQHWDQWSDELRERDPDRATRSVLEAFAGLCDAVGCAHENGILHRDLKPSNVLVDEHDEPRVLDLGLATVVRRRDAADSNFTGTGEFLGSLAWMSPERIQSAEADLPADVFALGLLLHRALTGRHAYERGASIVDVLEGVRMLPGSLVRPLCRDPRVEAACHAILSRSLAREPALRHADANELAADVRAALRGAPIRPPAAGRRFDRRTGVLVALASVVALAFVLRSAVGAREDFGARVVELLERPHEEASAVHEAFFGMDRSGARDDPEWGPPPAGSPRLNNWRLAAAQVYERFPLAHKLQLDPSRRWRSFDCTASGSRFAVLDDQGRAELFHGDDPGNAVALPASSRASSVHLMDGGRVCLLRLTDSPELRVFEIGARLEPTYVRSIPADGVVGLASEAPRAAVERGRSRVEVLDVRTGATIASIAHSQELQEVGFLPGDDILYSRDKGGGTRVWNLAGEPRLLAEPDLTASGLLRFARPIEGGQWVVYRNAAVIHDPGTNTTRTLRRFSQTPLVAETPEPGIALASDQTLRCFRPGRRSTSAAAWVETAAWTLPKPIACLRSDDEHLIALTRTGTLWFLDPDGRMPTVLGEARHSETVFDLTLALDPPGWFAVRGKRIVHVDPSGRELELHVDDTYVFAIEYDGESNVYFATQGGRVGVVASDGSAGPRWLLRHEHEASALAFDPISKRLCSGDNRGGLVVYAADGTVSETLLVDEGRARVSDLVWSPDGRLVAGGLTSGRLFWWRSGGEVSRTEDPGLGKVRSLAFDPADGGFVSGHDGGWIAVWEPGGSTPLLTRDLQGTEGESNWALAFSPDGRYLALGAGRRVSIRERSTWRLLFSANDHDGSLFALSFHPERPELVSGGEYGELLSWDFGAFADRTATRGGQ